MTTAVDTARTLPRKSEGGRQNQRVFLAPLVVVLLGRRLGGRRLGRRRRLGPRRRRARRQRRGRDGRRRRFGRRRRRLARHRRRWLGRGRRPSRGRGGRRRLRRRRALLVDGHRLGQELDAQLLIVARRHLALRGE